MRLFFPFEKNYIANFNYFRIVIFIDMNKKPLVSVKHRSS